MQTPTRFVIVKNRFKTDALPEFKAYKGAGREIERELNLLEAS